MGKLYHLEIIIYTTMTTISRWYVWANYTTWKGSMAQLPCIILVYDGPLLIHLLGAAIAIYFHYGVIRGISLK